MKKHKKIISCTKSTELKNLSKFLYKLKCMWKNQVEKIVQGLAEVRDEVL